MNLARTFLVALFLFPLAADAADDRALRQHAYDVPSHVFHTFNYAPTNDLPPTSIVIDERTDSAFPEDLERFVNRFHGEVIAEELLASYVAQGKTCARLGREDSGTVRVLRLDGYTLRNGLYDWQRLNRDHPELRAVTQVSLPAIDQTATYAVVRYDVFTKEGPAWAMVMEHERQPDGTWKTMRLSSARVKYEERIED